jgi:Cu/Ag efflux pump CusA
LTGADFIETQSARLDVQNDARLRLEDAVATLSNTAVSSASAATSVRRPAPVRIGDVADVVSAVEPPVGAALYDGRPAVFVQVSKLPWADTVRVTRQVEQMLRDLGGHLPPGSAIEPPVFRQASFVETSVKSVGRAMLIGSVLVILILVSFLRYGRLAIISLTALPLSILTAAAVLVAFGASINGMTLGGLAIAVGEVVDDAIVDVENVWRRLRENAKRHDPAPPLEVVRAASREIRGSVVYATLIVSIVLVPVLSLGGIAGRIFSPLAQAYILAITASLLVALTVTPAMCAWLLPPLAEAEPRLPRLAVRTLDGYRRLVRFVVERPRWVFTVSGALAAVAIAALPFIGGRFLPEFKETTLIGHLTAVPGTSLLETTRLAAAVDAELRASGVASHTHANVGRAALSEDPVPVHVIEFNVVLKDPRGERDRSTLDTASAMGRVPGLAFAVEGFLGERIHEVLSGETAPIVVKVIGPDLKRLRSLAARVAAGAAETSGLGTIRPEPQIDVPQIRIRPDGVALARYGVTPAEVADGLVAWRQGRTWTQILGRDGRVADVAIGGPPPARERAVLGELPIRR